jgi:phosphoribosylglycinamide formyltransferase-1
LSDVNILVLVSGNGTNLQALLDAEKVRNAVGKNTVGKNTVGKNTVGKIAVVVSDRSEAHALERARAAGIPAFIEKPNPGLPKPERRRELSDRINRLCLEKEIGLVVMAGFLSILAGAILEEYSGRIINLHPALLPRFGGQGMYGVRVHRAVLAAGETESGCTVHLVDAGTDTGPILLQRKVPVLPSDTPETLAERVHGEEHIAIVEGVRMMVRRLGE